MNHAFPCGTAALDFVGTLRARRNAHPREYLGSAAMLDSWFVEAGLLDGAPGADDSDLAAAVELREAVYVLVKARVRSGDSATSSSAVDEVAEQEITEEEIAVAIRTVNRVASGAPIDVQLDVHLAEHGLTRTGSVSQGLSTLARETIEIVGGDDAALLRECARPECTQVYLDRSRGHRREWCAMRTCGNRVKVSQFRARQRAERDLVSG